MRDRGLPAFEETDIFPSLFMEAIWILAWGYKNLKKGTSNQHEIVAHADEALKSMVAEWLLYLVLSDGDDLWIIRAWRVKSCMKIGPLW
jgi:hypothetical protein